MAKDELAVPAKNDSVALPDEMIAEMEAASREAKKSLDLNEDVRLPELRLVQATTQDVDAKPGQLIDTLTGDALDAAEVVLIDTPLKTRAYFPGNVGDPPSCTSPNALDGYGDPGDSLKMKGPHGGGSCQDCPQANWRQGGKCQLRYNYLAMVVSEGADPVNELPRGVMMHGTSAKVANRLNTLLLGSRFPWSNVVRLASKQEKNERGTYKVWEFVREREVTTEEMALAFQWHKTLKKAKSVTIGTPEKAEPQGDTDIPF